MRIPRQKINTVDVSNARHELEAYNNYDRLVVTLSSTLLPVVGRTDDSNNWIRSAQCNATHVDVTCNEHVAVDAPRFAPAA